VRVYALLAVCPAVLLVCALGIGAVVSRGRTAAKPVAALS